MDKQPGTITIGEVMQCYTEVERGGDLNVMSVEYCRRDGTIGRKDQCVKGGGKKTGHKPTGAIGYSLKENGLILLKDLKTGKQFDLAIRRIIRFNGQQVCH